MTTKTPEWASPRLRRRALRLHLEHAGTLMATLHKLSQEVLAGEDVVQQLKEARYLLSMAHREMEAAVTRDEELAAKHV